MGCEAPVGFADRRREMGAHDKNEDPATDARAKAHIYLLTYCLSKAFRTLETFCAGVAKGVHARIGFVDEECQVGPVSRRGVLTLRNKRLQCSSTSSWRHFVLVGPLGPGFRQPIHY